MGDPVFARIPGELGFSPFWLVWLVTVPEDYEPNTLKSVQGIERAAKEGEVQVREFVHDHGGDIGPDQTIMHCALVVAGTTLEHNGEDAVGKPGVKTRYLPLRRGWHKRYRVEFYGFTANEGVFAPDPASESRPMMPFSDIYVLFRDCDNGSKALPCQYVSSDLGAISERAMEVDITGDGDKGDTNNSIVAFPGKPPKDPKDPIYSPLWRVNQVEIRPEFDDAIKLRDNTLNQDESDVMSVTKIREMVAKGYFREPVHAPEDAAGNPVPGNEGIVFFNCPSIVPLEE